MSWATVADRVLAPLFQPGQPAPDARTVRDAYPFGPRAMWPYKVWLARLRAWRAAHQAGLASPASNRDYAARRVRLRDEDGETGDLFTITP